MPPIASILEAALYVSDLERSTLFYRDVLGLRHLSTFDSGRGAGFQVGPTILLLFRADITIQPGFLVPHGATGPGHVAFRVRPQDLPAWRAHLEARGVPIELEHSHEGHPPSLYFRDPDGNSLELAVPAIWPFSPPLD